MEIETTKKSNKRVAGLIVAFLLVVLAAIAIVFILLEKEKKKPKPNTTISNIIVEDGQSIKSVDPGYFTIQMQMLATSSDGENFVGTIANASENLYQVYVTIILEDTEEEVFRSELFPVGSQIEAFTVNRKLEKGSYKCVLTFHNVEEDGETEVSMVNVAYTLNVD